MNTKPFLPIACIAFAFSCGQSQKTGETEITKWQDDKAAAISLTYDDGTKNQFAVAMPIMDSLKIPATFFIITGEVGGSQYHGKFIGRPVSEIIKGTADTPTNKDNFFERANAIGYLGLKGTLPFHSDAGSIWEAGKVEEAYRLIDSGYKMVREHKFKPTGKDTSTPVLTWDLIRKYAANGHEFSSHTVTHPRLAVMTEPNILYELEKSKEEIAKELGPKATFSAECPYGTEDERVMSYAYKVYPALRNRMPEPFLGEISRFIKTTPAELNNEYVQWQRGATTKTPLPMMKSWVDTILKHDNNWLVLTFHGVDGIGWEALPHEELQEYYGYIASHGDKLWVTTFGDGAKYMRERMHGKVEAKEEGGKIVVELTHSLDTSMYDLPLTLRTYVPASWTKALVKQGGRTQNVEVAKNEKGSYVLYQLKPNAGAAEVSSEQ